jgi:hypothetical protein
MQRNFVVQFNYKFDFLGVNLSVQFKKKTLDSFKMMKMDNYSCMTLTFLEHSVNYWPKMG